MPMPIERLLRLSNVVEIQPGVYHVRMPSGRVHRVEKQWDCGELGVFATEGKMLLALHEDDERRDEKWAANPR